MEVTNHIVRHPLYLFLDILFKEVPPFSAADLGYAEMLDRLAGLPPKYWKPCTLEFIKTVVKIAKNMTPPQLTAADELLISRGAIKLTDVCKGGISYEQAPLTPEMKKYIQALRRCRKPLQVFNVLEQEIRKNSPSLLGHIERLMECACEQLNAYVALDDSLVDTDVREEWAERFLDIAQRHGASIDIERILATRNW